MGRKKTSGAPSAQNETLTAMGRLAGRLADEMSCPLTVLSTRIEVMLREAERQEVARWILDDLEVLQRHTRRLLHLARSVRYLRDLVPAERRPVDLNAIVRTALSLGGERLSGRGIRVVTMLDSALPLLLGDAAALEQMVLTLLARARGAMPRGGELKIETGPAPEQPGWLRLVISDNGAGIAPSDLPRIFDPFDATKLDRAGLDLFLSRRIIEAHGGAVDVRSRPGEGSTFVLRFPGLPPQIEGDRPP